MARILVVDDDPMICSVLSDFVTSQGHEAVEARHLQEAFAKLDQARPDLVFLDVNLPDGSGLEAIGAIRNHETAPEVIIITGEGSAAGASQAIHNGAWDYVRKPLSVESVELSLSRALQYRRRKIDHTATKPLHRGKIIGKSPALNQCLELAGKAAATDTSVLITGETGTGKELFARMIHENSARAGHDFVIVDCASLPPTLVESILFGHKKGTFTGASHSRSGLVAQAHQGTLFLDEVGEMPLEAQRVFLRVLQEQRFRPVGGATERVSNFRLVAATNRNLEEMVAHKTFRQDLLFRLRGFHCPLPPLRERGEDVIDLTMTHLKRLCRYAQQPMKGLCPQFLDVLQRYDWPGNVRELVNVITIAYAHVGDEPILYSAHLPAEIRAKVKSLEVQEESRPATGSPTDNLLAGQTPSRTEAYRGSPKQAGEVPVYPAADNSAARRLAAGQPLPRLQEAREAAIKELESEYLATLLDQTNKDMQQACTISGLSLSQLYRLLRKHRLK